MAMTICSIIVYGFEALMIYAMACIFDNAISEHYGEPKGKWNLFKNLLE